ncbi:MAG TPA: hypothetical protein VF286_07125 [Acidiphilium sp.]
MKPELADIRALRVRREQRAAGILAKRRAEAAEAGAALRQSVSREAAFRNESIARRASAHAGLIANRATGLSLQGLIALFLEDDANLTLFANKTGAARATNQAAEADAARAATAHRATNRAVEATDRLIERERDAARAAEDIAEAEILDEAASRRSRRDR